LGKSLCDAHLSSVFGPDIYLDSIVDMDEVAIASIAILGQKVSFLRELDAKDGCS
jgi:hypothetical protein